MSNAVSFEVSEAIETVYGAAGYARFAQLALQSDGSMTEADLVHTYQREPFEPVRRDPFGLNSDMEDLAGRTWGCPGDFPPDKTATVVQFGARPETTWPLAATLATGHASDLPVAINWLFNTRKQNEPFQFRLHARVEDPALIDRFADPMWDRIGDHQASSHSRPVRNGFSATTGADGRTLVTPSEEVQAPVTVSHSMLLDGPLPVKQGAADIVVAYDQLWRYPVGTREHLLTRMLSVLRQGGLFVTDGWNGLNHNAEGYPDWPQKLGRVGLIPMRGAKDYHLLDFNPFGLRERPPQVPEEVTNALGVLAAAKSQSA